MATQHADGSHRRRLAPALALVTISSLPVAGAGYLVHYARGGWTPERLQQSIQTELPVGSTKAAVESWATAHGFPYSEDNYIAGYVTASGTAELRLAELKRQGLRIITVDVDRRRGVNVPKTGTMRLLRGAGEIQIIFYLKAGTLQAHELDVRPSSL